MNNNGDESSSSTPTPPPSEESPHRRRGGLIVRRVRHSWEQALFTPPPRPSVPPVMGAPGRSAFGPYRPPPAPAPQGTTRGTGGSRVAVAGPVRIEPGRKRGREAGPSGAGGGGGGGGGGNVPQRCSVCNKVFGSSKALFGHMRSHPDRGWKGVHPPPAFRAEEEFADIRAADAAGRAAEEEKGEARAADAAGRAAEEEEGGEAGEGTSYRVPDLNHPPPPDAN